MGPQPVTEVPLGRSHGTFTLKATVNGMTTLPFTLDSGASAVVIPRSVAEELIQNGTLTEDDYVGPVVSSLADGSLHRNDVITLALLISVLSFLRTRKGSKEGVELAFAQRR